MKSSSFILPRFYRNFAWIFLLVSVGLLAFIVYLIWAKVTIIITPSRQVSDQTLTFTVAEASGLSLVNAEETVEGKISQVELTAQQAFPATGQKTLSADSGLVGEVTIINHYSQAQTLVVSTRLASESDPEKVLARLNKTVTVPAGQQLAVQVYTDNLDQFETIAPTKFIIPGLWPPLWQYIYAQNNQPLSKSGSTVAVVSQADLDQAAAALKDELYQKSLNEINQPLAPEQTLWPKLVSPETSDVVFDRQIGEETAEFTARLNLKAVVVVFDESQVFTLARNRLGGANSLIAVDPKTFSYSVDQVDLDHKTATVTAAFKGSALAAAGNEILNKDNLLGKTEAEIKSYFSQFPQIESVEVIFSPAWLKKTPRLSHKINLEISQ